VQTVKKKEHGQQKQAGARRGEKRREQRTAHRRDGQINRVQGVAPPRAGRPSLEVHKALPQADLVPRRQQRPQLFDKLLQFDNV